MKLIPKICILKIQVMVKIDNKNFPLFFYPYLHFQDAYFSNLFHFILFSQIVNWKWILSNQYKYMCFNK
jgi:hypothetical protein